MILKRTPTILILGIILLLLTVNVSINYAASSLLSIDFASITVYNNNCASRQLVYRVSIVVTGVANGGSFTVTEYFEGSGGPVSDITNRSDTLLGTAIDLGGTTNGTNWTAPNDTPQVYVEATAGGVTVTSPVIEIDCATGTYRTLSASAPSASNASSIVSPPDDRINWQYGDLYGVLYRGTDSDGNSAINVYCYDGENSSFEMQVSEANMSSGISANGCNVTFYVLPNGGYQFNIEYDGKRYEIECADFECNPPEMRYFDPNE